MSTIFAPQTHAPRRPSTRVAPVAAYCRRTAAQLRRWNEGLNSDDRATVSEMTLRPYHQGTLRG